MGNEYSKMGEAGNERVVEQCKTFSALLKSAARFPAFKRVSTNEKRVAIMYEALNKRNLILPNNMPTCVETVKTATTSSAHREQGNVAYLNKPQNLELALLCYNKAIATAPFPTSEKPYATELALAFGNRSALMLARKQYKECLRDIGQAFKYHNPDNREVIVKLWRRGSSCLHLAGNLGDDTECFKEMGKALLESSQDVESQDLILIREQLTKIALGEGRAEVSQSERVRRPQLAEGPNPQVPALSSCVELAYNPKYGRFVRATRDIQPGEVLLFEKPYMINPTPDLQHCDNCSKPTDALLPCKTCHVVMFCSETCRDESWQRSHELECPVLLSVVDYAESETARVLRTLMTALSRFHGVRGLFDYVQQLEASTASDGRIRGFNDEGKYLSSDYSTLHYLVDHTERRTQGLLFEFAVKAAVILIHVDRHSNASLSRELKDVKMKKFVGGLLMKYLLSGRVNAVALYGYEDKDREGVHIGGGVFPVASMINHACQSNTHELFYGVMALFTSSCKIAQGDPVTSVYIDDIYVQNSLTRERKLTLQTHFFFSCECCLCSQVWPQHCQEQAHYRVCLQCEAPLPGAFMPVADTKCLQCKTINRAMDLQVAEFRWMSNFGFLLARARSGDDLMSEVYILIAELNRLALPQKGYLFLCKKLLNLMTVVPLGHAVEEKTFRK